MNVFDQFLLPSQLATPSVERLLLSFLLALVVGQLIGWAYSRTYEGVAYSKNFTHALVLLCMIVTMVISVIGSNLTVAFGFLGAMAMIRFRTPVRDARDTAFVFLSVGAGLAIGIGAYAVAAAGAMGICLVAMYLRWTSFGTRTRFDALLRFQGPADVGDSVDFIAALKKYCLRHRVLSVSITSGGAGDESTQTDYAYEVLLRDSDHSSLLIDALGRLSAVENIHLAVRLEEQEL